MMWLLLIFLAPADGNHFVYEIVETVNGQQPSWSSSQTIAICGNRDITANFKFPVKPQNQYILNVTTEIQPFSRMILRFDSPVSLKLIEPTSARISKFPGASLRLYQFRVMFTKETSLLRIQVFGSASGLSVPYVLSVILNNVELCEREPTLGFLDAEIQYKGIISEDLNEKEEGRDLETPFLDESCGRRKVVHTELIVHGEPTLPGDWPWHVAIKRVYLGLSSNYTCGGTLLSKTLVLTAAHCVTTEGHNIVPNSLTIELGNYNLHRGDIKRQEVSVLEVIVHPDFDVRTLNNDIALLKLKSEAVFDDYVQPACFWLPELTTEEHFGTVVGWGINEHGVVSPTLQQITIPIVSEKTCLTSDPKFFKGRLNSKKFCAGFANGTSACNGDSGGGLMIFVPDTAGKKTDEESGDTDKTSGAWYVRGIVSITVRGTESTFCDPNQYTIFTDVKKYLDWLIQY